MKFDWTVNVSMLIHLFGSIVAAIAAYYKLVGQISRVESLHLSESVNIAEIKADIKDMKKDSIAALEARIRALEIKVK